jgi:hypothetical protein
MNKQRKRTRRGAHYRALAEGYAMLNSPIADSLHRAADHFDETDPPLDLVIDPEKAGKNERGGTPVE